MRFLVLPEFERRLLLYSLSACVVVFIDHPESVECGPGSSVGIVTGYGLDGPEIEW